MLLSFHNKPAVKEFYCKRMDDHVAADDLRQGYGYWENGKGCSVGCTIHGSDHSAYEREDGPGLPKWLAYLQDVLFEGLDLVEARQFSARFFYAIPVGIDLEPVRWRFCAFLMRENIEGVPSFNLHAALKEQVLSVLHQVLALHESAITTGEWNVVAAANACNAAAIARRAAGSAWCVADSAWCVASAEYASSAGCAASVRSAASSAGCAAYKRYADQLLALLEVAQ